MASEPGPTAVIPTPKQVVFLFMAGAVTAVVSFLFGVLVGRGAPNADAVRPAWDDGPALVEGVAPPGDAGDDGVLSYHYRLESESAVEESLGRLAAASAPAPDPAPGLANAEPAAPAAGEADGFTVQVGALRDREQAQRIADGLVARGFPAFVAAPATDASVAIYRVRVGRYAEHRVAERMKRRLETEEHFQPWITR